MLKTIKRYEMNDNVSLKDLIDNGFINVEPNRLSYYYPLYDDIELFIYFYIDEEGNLSFEDTSMIDVIDDNYGQRYTPFYVSKKPFHFLDIIVFKYNEVMDSLVAKGILKYKIPEEEITRTLKKD